MKGVPHGQLTQREFNGILETGGRFDTATMSDVLNYCSQMNPQLHDKIFRVTPSTMLTDVIGIFATGVHRVPLVAENDPNSVLNVISQSDVLRLFVKCLPFLEE